MTFALLFNAMSIHRVVPSMFGTFNQRYNNYNYRGITLSVHISKVLEMCILDIYGN